MFECEFSSADDATVVAAVESSARAEAAAGARRLAAIAELTRRRLLDDDERALWACDWWDCAAAEVAAAMNISQRQASGQMRIAATLRNHLPLVGELFRRGLLSARVVSTITWRTRLITDDAVWAQLDAAIAQRVRQWGPMPEVTLIAALDALVLRWDADARIDSGAAARTRDFTTGDREDEAGLTSVWGKLLAPDAAVLNKKVAAMAATVCADDPRSLGERRADALGALANGNHHLPCACTSATCSARTGQPAPKSSVVIHVLTGQMPAPTTPATKDAGTAVLSGTEAIPTPLLAALVRDGAKLRPLPAPEELCEPVSGYRPSTAMARHVRNRDLTCRFPACTMPAEFCDIDHVVPYPLGATHPSNLACLCRKHHHLKTFWAGDWEFTLRPDGTAIWTSPTARTYTTHPGCRSYFPDWDTNTGELPPPPTQPAFDSDRGLMMPRRKRTRAADRDARIKAERQHNNSDPPTTPDPPSGSDPPPF
ncbi:DUF222 domain-containing protein [Mycobacterium sp. 2YAF39]|uniref:HNH endonuclease signature motif containing protein n=1 Tax=Mycobacterium sp. 2YAF39 TaxID=3233033 RepID=UPI003F98DD7F